MSIFLSHSSQNADTAKAILSFLESKNQPCWIAPRDIPPGADWAEAIIDGIDSSEGMILILSEHSNKSPQVRRELERAVSKGITIYPLVMEKIELTKWMQYYISAHQWHDAFQTSVTKALPDLLKAIKSEQESIEVEADLSDLSALLENDLASLSSMLEESEEATVLLTPGARRKVAVLHISTQLNGAKIPSSVKRTVSNTISNLIGRFAKSYGAFQENLSSTSYRCIFGIEQAIEDDTARALTCGISLFNGFSELNSVLRKKNLSIEFGLGVSSGMLDVEKIPEGSIEFLGDVLEEAKNLSEEASNEILASSVVYKISRGQYTWEEGSGEAHRISDYSMSVSESRVLMVRSPFVGREEEISKLKSVLEQQEEGTGKNRLGGSKHIVLGISGEAGIGKSRLVHEFTESYCTNDDILVLKGQTLSYAQPPYWLWTTLLRNLLNIEHGSGLGYSEFIAKLNDYSDDEDLMNSAPFFAELLSVKSGDKRIEELDDEAIVLETKIAFRNLLKSLSINKKLVVVLEDLHWLDESSKAVLEFALGNCNSKTPIVFFLLYRPEREDGTAVEFDIHPNYAVTEELGVSEVSGNASEDLIEQLLEVTSATGVNLVSSEVKAFLLDHSRGNPLYLEELVLDLVESEVLIEQDEEWCFGRPISDIFVPDSLTGLLQARFDMLPESCRAVLQNSSVLGSEFQLKLYNMMTSKLLLGRTDSDTLGSLERKKMLLSEKSAFEKKYLFKHILVHDSAYSSILEDNLKKLHRVAAESIEEMLSEESDKVAPILMYHYEKAEDFTKVLAWGIKTLEQLVKSYSNAEALELSQKLEQILETIPKSDQSLETLFNLLSYREKILNLLGRRDEQELTLNRMIEIAEETDCDEFLATSLKSKGQYAQVTGQMDSANDYFKKALKIAREVGNRNAEGDILNNTGWLLYRQGRMKAAQENLEMALDIAREVGNRRFEGHVIGNLGQLYEEQSRFNAACEYFEKTLEIAYEFGDHRSEGIALVNLGKVYYKQGRVDTAREHCEKALKIARKIGNRRFEGHVIGNLGNLYINQGRLDTTREHYEKTLEIAREVGDRRSEGIALVNLGNLYYKLGRVDAAHKHSEKALEIAREFEDRRFEGYVLEKLGNLYFEKNNIIEAHNYYLKAFKIISDLKILKDDVEDFIKLHDKVLSAGYSEEEFPWPAHWPPQETLNPEGDKKK